MNVFRVLSVRNRTVLINAAALVLAVAGAVFGSSEVTRGIKNGIIFCAEALVPSVLPYMIIACFAVKSGVNALLGRLLDRASLFLFGLSGKCAAAMIIGLIGGYPVAAKGIEALYKSGAISGYEARKCAYSAFCAGTGFVVSFAGARLLGSAEIGWAILAAQIISALILAIANRFIFPQKNNIDDYNSLAEVKLSEAFIESVSDGAYAAIDMCAMVIVFSSFSGLTEKMPILSVILEVCNACNILSENNNIALLAFAIGFGGLCVHLQIFRILKNIKLNKYLFFLYRIIQGIITSTLTFIFIKLFRISLPVFSSLSSQPELSLSGSVTGGIMLLLTGVCLIFNFNKRGD